VSAVFEPGQVVAKGPGDVSWLVYSSVEGTLYVACYLRGALVQLGPKGYFRLDSRGQVLLSAAELEAIAAVGPISELPVLPGQEDLVAVDPWPVLAPAALSGLAGEVVTAIDPHTEADPVAVLVSLLDAFGSSVGSCPHVRADGADHPGRLYAVIVGRSSRSRKGTSWRHCRNLMRHADPDWWSSRVLSGLSSGEGLIAAVADPDADRDGNPVGGVTDKRLFVIEEEFGRVLAVKSRENNTLSATVRSAWDSGDLRTMTKTPMHATGAHISVLGHITLEELRASLTELDRANGFGNRFIFVLARRSKLLPSGGNIDEAEVVALATRLRAALVFARPIGRVFRDETADAYWSELYADLAVEDEHEGLAGALCARAEAHVTRFALLYALLDRSKLISLGHLMAAEALWRYCEASVRYIFGDATGDPVAEALLAATLEAGDDGLSGREQHALFGRHLTARRLAVARQSLAQRGLITETVDGTGGRARTVLKPLRTANKDEQSP
jgi:hypothetical protein